jgi:hypothetical protein
MVCLGLGGRRKHTLQDNPILQARILTVEGSSSTLGVNYTFGEVLPSLGRRRSRRISTLKDDNITTPGPSPLGSSPGIRLGRSPRGLGQLSPEDISPVRGLDNSIPAIVKGKCALGPFLSILVIECQHKCLNVNLYPWMDIVPIKSKGMFLSLSTLF